MSDADAFDDLHVATHASTVYREAVAASLHGLPSWLVPFSVVDGAMLESIAVLTQARANGRLLDVACGSGGSGLWIAERTGASVTGVDFAAGAIEIARRSRGDAHRRSDDRTRPRRRSHGSRARRPLCGRARPLTHHRGAKAVDRS